MKEYGYDLAVERGLWLRKQGLFLKAVDHYNEILPLFQEKKIELYKSLSFCLLRVGDLETAITILDGGLSLLNIYDTQDIADFENLLGQVNRQAGRWNIALEHYARAHRAFTKEKNNLGAAGIHINRGFIYAAQGLYDDAKQEEERALNLLYALKDEQNVRRSRMFAQLNMGTAYRHSGNYKQAEEWYRQSLQIARSNGDREGICFSLSNLGITYCLQGSKSRIDGDQIQAVKYQIDAWKNLVQSLEIAGQSHWQSPLADGLSRIAKVYEELYRILQTQNDMGERKAGELLLELQKMTVAFQPPSEVEYEYDLLIPRKFSESNNLEKSARLFELSYLIADGAEEFHRALDSLMEFSRLMLELKEYELVPVLVRKTERIKGYDFQESLFDAVAEITMADLSYFKKDYSVALNKYAAAFEVLAKQTGYSTYLLTDRIKNLSDHISSLPTSMRLQWCDTLEDRWLNGSVSTTRPDMLRMLEDIRYKTINDQGNRH